MRAAGVRRLKPHQVRKRKPKRTDGGEVIDPVTGKSHWEAGREMISPTPWVDASGKFYTAFVTGWIMRCVDSILEDQ